MAPRTCISLPAVVIDRSLLITEPEAGDPSAIMRVIQQRFARRLNQRRKRASAAQSALCDFTPEAVWQKRFYDFNVWSERKRLEKLRYMHRNPVKCGLVEQPDQWKWSSFRAYFHGERGPVRVNFQEWAMEIKARPVQNSTENGSAPIGPPGPPFAKSRGGWGTLCMGCVSEKLGHPATFPRPLVPCIRRCYDASPCPL
jgi:hypothetical protein